MRPNSGANLRVVARGLRFPEGPIAMSDGSVLLVEVARGTLSRVRPDGEIEVVAELGGGPNGAALGPDGAVYVCNNGGFRWHEGRHGLLPLGQADDYSGGRLRAVGPAPRAGPGLDAAGPPSPPPGGGDTRVHRAAGAVGGDDGSGPQRQLFWALPDLNGDLPGGWRHTDVTDLGEGGLVGASAVVSGSTVFLIGGTSAGGVRRCRSRLPRRRRRGRRPLAPDSRLSARCGAAPGRDPRGPR